MNQKKNTEIVNVSLTRFREMRGLVGDLEVLAHETFNHPGLDEVAADCSGHLRTALDALYETAHAIKAANRSLYEVNLPGVSMKSKAA
ncbi:hypothetical protein [Ensifer aridi]|uniref:hypothetical protein n=1 Tax=Ensifer aridi TaxID=1708715 RepID=UPI000A10B58C|nr:hypothetical protein [Ensifer aridi]